MIRLFHISLILLIIIVGCSTSENPAPPNQAGAWLVYWAADSGLAELESYGSLFEQVSIFAYELDEDGHPVLPDSLASVTPRFLAIARRQGFQPWATVVNDVRSKDGTVILKDGKILKQILADPDKRQSHARQLAVRVSGEGFAGLELDYEGLGSREQEDFGSLIAALGSELRTLHLGLRVVVEPKRGPLPAAGLASLTVMGYNLHGPFSGPGPRATPEFIGSLGPRGHNDVAAAPAIALATGGFVWLPNGKVRQVSWHEARQEAQRAPESGRSPRGLTPYARFPDGAELWHEDPQSLEAKWRAAGRAGFRSLWLWHLGGNDENLFQWLAQVRGRKNRN